MSISSKKVKKLSLRYIIDCQGFILALIFIGKFYPILNFDHLSWIEVIIAIGTLVAVDLIGIVAFYVEKACSKKSATLNEEKSEI